MNTWDNHPAKFSEPILDKLRWLVTGDYCARDRLAMPYRILDPFAGTGRVHRLSEVSSSIVTWGVEIEPEGAAMHPRTIVGDAQCLPFADRSFDCVATSPPYANRMADKHDAQEKCQACRGSGVAIADNPGRDNIFLVNCEKCGGKGQRTYKRLTYKHTLGHDLHPQNAGGMQWGDAYRDLHVRAWTEVLRVLRPDGLFLLNISDHVRGGNVVPVADWHRQTCLDLGFRERPEVQVETKRMRYGANGSARVGHESILVFRSPLTSVPVDGTVST